MNNYGKTQLQEHQISQFKTLKAISTKDVTENNNRLRVQREAKTKIETKVWFDAVDVKLRAELSCQQNVSVCLPVGVLANDDQSCHYNVQISVSETFAPSFVSSFVSSFAPSPICVSTLKTNDIPQVDGVERDTSGKTVTPVSSLYSVPHYQFRVA